MGMHVDLKQGQSIEVFLRNDPSNKVRITLERKMGHNTSRVLVEADAHIALVPPNKQPNGAPRIE